MKRKSRFKRNLLISMILIAVIWYLKNYNKSEAVSIKNINSDFSRVIVSKNYELGEDYKPSNLQKPNIIFADESTDEERLVDGIIKEPLENLVRAAKND